MAMHPDYIVPATADKAVVQAAISFPSLGEWMRFSATDDRNRRHELSRNKDSGRKWDYNTGYDAAVKLMTAGWSKGAAEVLDAAGGLTVLQDTAERVSVVTDAAGFMALPQLALAGDMDCWLAADIAEQPQQPVFTLLAPVSVAARADSRNFTARGAAILTLVNLLEAAGVRVDLHSYHCEEHDDDSITTCCVRVKAADQALDLEALAAVFAHPASFRRIGFGVIERLARDTLGGDYGVGCDMKKETLEYLFGDDKVAVLPREHVPSLDIRGTVLRYLDALVCQDILNDDQVNELKAAL